MREGGSVSSETESRPGHAVWVRLCHWLLAASVLVLGFTGVVILMAHPRLYWGEAGNDLTPAWIELPLGRNYQHGGWASPAPFTADAAGPVSRVRTYSIFNENGWARSLHFLVAWLFVVALGAYLALGLLSGHLIRSLVPRGRELQPGLLWQDLKAHLRLPAAPAPVGPPYGLLQKLSYALVALIGLPLLVLSGLAQSPAVGAGWPWIPALFGGSQSARSIHFLLLCAMTLFLIAHLAMVALSGAWRQLKGMTFGGPT